MRFELIRVSLVATFNAKGNGEGVISDYNRNFHLSSLNSLQKIIFLFVQVMAMLENIVTTLGGKMIIMATLFDGFDVD